MKAAGVFDVIGPIMVGPSSSHTAGAVRLAKMARLLLGEEPCQAELLLHGSFKETYQGHGTDIALIAGLLGMEPDNVQIGNSFMIAAERGLSYKFIGIDLGDAHPNTVRFILEGAGGYHLEMEGSSTGGGSIMVSRINGFEVEIYGDMETLITVHHDKPGIVTQVTKILSEHSINIAYMKLARQNRGKLATMIIETDQCIDKDVLKKVEELNYVNSVRYVGKV